MATFNKAEFWQELEATDEAFVRHKLTIGGYSAPKQKLASEWLKLREEQRQKKREVLELHLAMRSMWWGKFTAIVTAIGVTIALATLVWPK